MKCDTGQLRAYLDDALDASERAAASAHLATCPSCHAELAALRARRAAVEARFDDLEPAAGQVPTPARGLARFRAEGARSRPTVWTVLQGGFTTMRTQMSYNNRWRPAAIGASAVVILAILFSFAPVREVAADFLGLFRVRKFAVIPLDPAQAERLEGLAQQAETILGEPIVLREEGPEQVVTDAAQASALAGFPVRVPAELPANAQQTKFTVQTGAAVRFEVERTTLAALMQAAGMSTAGLPQTEKISATVDLPVGVSVEYRSGATFTAFMSLLQLPSPQVDVPEGVDPIALSETGLQFLGIPADEAHRLATTVDWTSTLVIPMPTDVAQAQEVSIDGTTGLLIQSDSGDHKSNADTVLLWERDGILYALNSRNLDRKVVLQVADSLK